MEESLPRYKGSKRFCFKTCVGESKRIVEHFSYLFSSSVHAPVRINLINTGDCREVVQGLVQFYVRELNNSKRVMPIQVTMYSDPKKWTMLLK